jgi:sugar lactone lactonase YvrE
VAFDASGGAWATSGMTQPHQLFTMFGMEGLFRLAAGTYAKTSVSMPGDPYEIALDGAGAMWVTSLANRTLTKLSTTVTPVPNPDPTGTVSTIATCELPTQPGPRALALDATGHAWVANGEHVTRVSPTGTLVGSYALGGPAGAICADSARGVIWATAGNRLVKLSIDGTVLMTTVPFTRSPYNDFAGLTVDSAGRVWLAVPGDNAIARFDADGAMLPRVELDWPVRDVAIDSQGQIWAAVGLIHAFGGVQVARLSPQGVLRQTFGRTFGTEAVYVAPNDTVWAKDTNGQITRFAP